MTALPQPDRFADLVAVAVAAFERDTGYSLEITLAAMVIEEARERRHAGQMRGAETRAANRISSPS